ncbi:MAG: cell division protein FtsQ [Bacteroidaceae bacterium]|nr:cell division protein FtsQ [Bacteroidaceae bacterium]MDO4956766.1 cell division protein FtsQ [Bacteroidales bacterium]
MIKKVLITLLVLGLGTYFVAAITLFNRSSDDSICQEVSLSISDSVRAGFIGSTEIEKILREKNLYPIGKRVKDINLQEIEKTLKQNPFISTVTCYRSATDKICIEATQRIPVLRVMTEGANCYLDGNGHIMPATNSTPAHLVIVTGSGNADWVKKYLLPLGRMIQGDEFWNNMIEQINVTPEGGIELVPRVGDHVVYLGLPVNFDDKLYRLRLFYEKGLSKIGWNKYSRINLEFSNQIICTKK